MKRKAFPISFVWIPFGLHSRFSIENSNLVYYLLVTMAVWLILEKILVRR
jgi:hypothetical protein